MPGRFILPFSVASVVSGFANIGTNLAGFFQGTTS
ncbi:PPE family protein [Mycobacterium tuberculosis]|nr:PPE family protein PPE24 [Mycobacterium tuberculosis]SHD64369.1 PPE family protein [Mycobacterium tuberculosis]